MTAINQPTFDIKMVKIKSTNVRPRLIFRLCLYAIARRGTKKGKMRLVAFKTCFPSCMTGPMHINPYFIPELKVEALYLIICGLTFSPLTGRTMDT